MHLWRNTQHKVHPYMKGSVKTPWMLITISIVGIIETRWLHITKGWNKGIDASLAPSKICEEGRKMEAVVPSERRKPRKKTSCGYVG